MIPWIRLTNPDAAYLYYKTYAETQLDMIFFPHYEHYYYFGTIISFQRNKEAIMNIATYGYCDKPLMSFMFHAWVYMATNNNIRVMTWGSMFKDNKYRYLLHKIGGEFWHDTNNETNYVLATAPAKKYLEEQFSKGRYQTDPFTRETYEANQEHLLAKLQK